MRKYNIGDQVKLGKNINYSKYILPHIKKHKYVVTISKIGKDGALMFKEIKGYAFSTLCIEKEFIDPNNQIDSRFDILDL